MTPHSMGLIIRPDKQAETTQGGLFIPDMAKEKSLVGIVEQVGAEVEDVSIGDRVVFAAGHSKDLGDGTVFVIFNPDKLIIYGE